MIDLHLHTSYSDGTDSLIELLNKAEELKLEYISITDHDTCEAYEELEKIDVKQYFSGKIIKGVEIKCAYRQRLIEILGYNVNTKTVNDYMDSFYQNCSKDKLQQKYFNLLHNKCTEMGLKLSSKENIKFNPKKDWATVAIYEEIKEHIENKEKLPADLWQEFTTFSKKYCGRPDEIFYIDKTQDYPSLEEAVKLVKEAGGMVFLPHIFIYKGVKDKNKLLDDIVQDYAIDGVECMHSEFTDEEIQYLMNYTTEHKLYKSGGSDYHGINKPKVKMGVGKGNLKIESNLIKEWYKNI